MLYRWAVDGYPAFRLVKAGSNEVVTYDGDRAARCVWYVL